MLSSRYLHRIDADPFEGCPGVFAAADYRRPDAWRYLCSYADGKRHKPRIFALLRQHGQPEDPGAWDLHHVVEGQHAADIDFAGRLDVLYKQELPCVLLHKNEHVAYNQLLHVKATDELYRDVLPQAMLERARHVAAEAADRRRHPVLRARVESLRSLYRNAYRGDPVLQRVADNVFDDALRHLR